MLDMFSFQNEMLLFSTNTKAIVISGIHTDRKYLPKVVVWNLCIPNVTKVRYFDIIINDNIFHLMIMLPKKINIGLRKLRACFEFAPPILTLILHLFTFSRMFFLHWKINLKIISKIITKEFLNVRYIFNDCFVKYEFSYREFYAEISYSYILQKLFRNYQIWYCMIPTENEICYI